MQRRVAGHEEGWLLSYADLITNLLLFFVVLLSAANLSKSKMQQISKAISGEAQPESLESIQKEIDKTITEKGLSDVVTTKLQDDGLVVELKSGFVFPSGKAILNPSVEAPLAAMLTELKPYANTYSFAVEGHTDATPLQPGAQFASNWELSASRAISVRERMERVGIDARKIRVEGYADTRPLPEEELAKEPTTEARNARLRRVVVRVY